ncbi:copper resistance protein B [Xanthomonas hyacinthi]|uniref:Copper resistance protein B n=1 Tax=Xanthomonas hyacinthi TaxID=56455 RepID=A0A2S7EUT8_9XANT|nr:copper resistance protein B [Xanthomonas hyacinthi]KLD77947.1 copper resistance protein CopB [Xanthomonas hyacinthi DSM 19077]PPU96827.1 copper resistance protein B [Xanthomonas hyacinthi]QGY76221.1 copper resistance protein B [Xanthomonas hyacinthi]
MNAAPLATLAQAIGLALLLAHGAARAQHVHAPGTADADIAAAAAPVSTSAPAACVCPPPDDGMQPETGQSGPGTGNRGPGKAQARRARAGAAAACTCATAAALPREPIPPLTDADRAAAFPVLRTHTMLHAPSRTGYLLFDRLEGWDADHGSGQAWEASAWYGGDIDRLWLRSEGERSGGRTEAADLEALYGHAVSPWWDLLVGVKQDVAPGDARTSAAFGVQGMAPYKFEVAATLYVGAGGKASARVQGEYEVLLSNRWILQPRLQADAAFADDRAHGVGSGLSTLEAGLRLRYEISRRFAPYLGVVHERAFGATSDYRRDAGEAARETRVVAGVRVWF